MVRFASAAHLSASCADAGADIIAAAHARAAAEYANRLLIANLRIGMDEQNMGPEALPIPVFCIPASGYAPSLTALLANPLICTS